MGARRCRGGEWPGGLGRGQEAGQVLGVHGGCGRPGGYAKVGIERTDPYHSLRVGQGYAGVAARRQQPAVPWTC